MALRKEIESQSGVGMPAIPGEAVYDSDKQEYRITGSGKNMWFDKDEFHFAWKRIKGDFILTTQAKLQGEGVDPHRKLGWMYAPRTIPIRRISTRQCMAMDLLLCSFVEPLVE